MRVCVSFRLLVIILESPDPQAKIIALTIIGSLAYCGDLVQPELTKHQVYDALLSMLYPAQNDPVLLEALVRALKAISKLNLPSKAALFTENHIQHAMSLLTAQPFHSNIAESIMVILSNACQTREEQAILYEAGALQYALKALLSNTTKVGPDTQQLPPKLTSIQMSFSPFCRIMMLPWP